MIIFGTRGITGTKQTGTFHCPHCGGGSPYRKRRARRFFTLYFVPLVPLDMLGEYVECGTCKGTYDVRVLEYDPEEQGRRFQALFAVAMKQVMIAMLLSDGVVEDEEVRELREIFRDLSGMDVDEAELREEIAAIERENSTPLELVGRLAGGLNDSGKEMVLRSAFRIAAADGSVSVDEERLMEQIGEALGLSPAHYRGVLQELTAVTA